MRFAALVLASALAVTFVSCSDGSRAAAPTGPQGLVPAAALTETVSERFPVAIEVYVPCAVGGAGELVELSGNLHALFHITTNGQRIVVKTHFQPQGIRGVGQSSGAKYRGTGVSQDIFSGSLVGGQFSFTYVNNFRIIGQGRGNNFMIHETYHVTVNANGVLTAEVENVSVDCK